MFPDTQVKQLIALNAHFNWLLKPRISFAIHLRETRAGFAAVNIAIVSEID